MNQPLTTPTATTDTLLALYALLDTPHKDRARREIETIMERITIPVPQSEDSYDRLMAEIAEQTGVSNDEADSFDPSDRF